MIGQTKNIYLLIFIGLNIYENELLHILWIYLIVKTHTNKIHALSNTADQQSPTPNWYNYKYGTELFFFCVVLNAPEFFMRQSRALPRSLGLSVSGCQDERHHWIYPRGQVWWLLNSPKQTLYAQTILNVMWKRFLYNLQTCDQLKLKPVFILFELSLV